MTQTFHRFSLTHENALHLLAFGTGLIVRLAQLGAAPLGDGEARAALQALDMARSTLDSGALSNTQPLYTGLTALFFNLVIDSNAGARILPALAGSLLVFLPLVILNLFPALRAAGRWAGVILAFGLALDPGLVLLSRSAGSDMPGLLFTSLSLLGLAVITQSQARAGTGAILGGAAFSAALFSGTSLWVGLLTAALALLMARFWMPRRTDFSAAALMSSLPTFFTAALVSGAVWIIAVPVVLGSPLDLSGLGGSLAGFAGRLVQPSGVPALRLISALLVYHPLPLVFGLTAAIRMGILPLFSTAEDEGIPGTPQTQILLARWLSLGTFAALLLILLLPGREVTDLAWVLLPLWSLAALQLSISVNAWLDAQPSQLLTAASVYTFLFLMFVLNLLNLTNLWPDLIARFQLAGALAQVSVIIAGIALMLIIVSALFWLYWSPLLMSRALSLSTALLLTLALLGATWSLTRLRPDSTVELWRASPNRAPAPGQLAEIYATLSQASMLESGHRPSSFSGGGVRTEMEVVLTAPLSASPALNWALRGFQLRSAAAVDPRESAGAVLTAGLDAQTNSRLNTKYRGQDLIWQSMPAWSGVLPPDLFAWLFDREAPASHENLIVWVRGDLFPGGTTP